jgi:mono/diheme cytochrome c family protein
MNKLGFIVLILVAAVAAQTPAGNAATGKDLYLKYSCYACHGFDGHGGAGARISATKLTQAVFTSYVRNPRQMPSYSSKVLTDAQLADLYAYIKTLPDAPPAKSIPLLNQILSEQ